MLIFILRSYPPLHLERLGSIYTVLSVHLLYTGKAPGVYGKRIHRAVFATWRYSFGLHMACTSGIAV